MKTAVLRAGAAPFRRRHIRAFGTLNIGNII
jgi:hypothetical protein